MNDTEILDEFSANPSTKRPQKLIKEQKITPEQVERDVDRESRRLDIAQKNLVNVYRNEKKIAVRVAPSYAKYFGRVMRVAINGISVAVKCNGETMELPESFAAEVLRRISEIDKQEMRAQGMSNVDKNRETSPGQLQFFN